LNSLVRWKNWLFEFREKRRPLFTSGLVLASVAVGIGVGVGAEIFFLAWMLGWLTWESRPRFYLAMGLHERCIKAARPLALEAGPSFRGDIFRLSEVAALLNLGRLEEAKEVLRQISPEWLSARARMVLFLSQSTLYSRLGDGDTALVMVEAAEAEATELGEPWQLFPRMNRSLALFEMGRYDEAAALLREIDQEDLFPQARAYLDNNLAWALAMGSGDPEEALELAQRAVHLRGKDPYCLGTLGFCMVRAGVASRAALDHLSLSLEGAPGRSPSGKALLLAASVEILHQLGDHKGAARLTDRLGSLPAGEHHLANFRALLEAG
jgi:tetratricopeptide (TPR) repeat protein